jgi:hypothetical protein
VLFELLKFVLRTRFSRPFLIFFALMIVYFVFLSQTVFQSGTNLFFGYYATAFVAFFLTMALATGGVMVLKSDRDYLFALPLSTRDLSISIFFAQFLAFGVTVLLMFGVIAQPFTSPMLIVDLVALALIATSLGVIAPALQTRVRIVLSIALAVWTLLSFENVPFTPGSAFNGNLYDGTATLLILAAVTTTAAFRGLARIELDMMKSMVRTTSGEVKSPTSFAGKSPIGAIYSMNLSTMSLAGRVNMAGSSRYMSRRVKTQWVVLATSAAAAAYFIFALSLGPSTVSTVSTNIGALPAEILVAAFLAFFGFFISQSAITNERVWLSLTSLPAASYFRHLITARVISLMLIITPFAVADAALLGLGYGDALGALVVVAIVIPSSFVLQVALSAYIAPIQVKGDDLVMPAQFNLKQMATGLLLAPTMVLVIVASLLPIVAEVGALILCIFAILLTMSGSFWSRVLTRLTENGFI